MATPFSIFGNVMLSLDVTILRTPHGNRRRPAVHMRARDIPVEKQFVVVADQSLVRAFEAS